MTILDKCPIHRTLAGNGLTEHRSEFHMYERDTQYYAILTVECQINDTLVLDA